MHSFVKKLILFSLFFAVLNALYLYACILGDWNFAKRIEAISFKSPNYKCIVLGNSLTMDGIDSELLSIRTQSTYNLSIGGSSLKTNLIQLQEYLRIANEDPKTVILGLGSYINNFQSENINPIVEFTMENHQYGIKDLPMIKFRWIIFELLKKVISADHRNAEIIEGQLRISRMVEDTTKNTDPLPSLPIDDYQNSLYIKKIALLCKKKNIRLILCEMPGFKRTQNQTDIGPHKIFINKNFYVDLYNFNNIKFVSNFDSHGDWLGNSHLNKFGAKKYTELLNESLFK
jgi:hypothetical protein